MSKPDPYPYYTVWSGSLNLGDTPGVFHDSYYCGLILQIPFNISYIPSKPDIEIMLVTNEVEIFNGNVHFVYLDWVPGQPLPNPVGQIDDQIYVPDMPEYHRLNIATNRLALGNHTLTIIVNLNVPVGLKDDFVLHRIDVDETAGARIGAFV